MNDTELPHAVALSRELELELQRVDALQQVYMAQLVDELRDMSFLAMEECCSSPLRSGRAPSPTLPYFNSLTTATGATHNIHFSNGAHAHNGQSAPVTVPASSREEMRKTKVTTVQNIPAVSSSSPNRKEISVRLSRRRHNNEQFLLAQVTERDGNCEARGARQSSLSPATLPTPPPLPQRSCRALEVRRAQRALRCIREDRHAHFNAKARRAQELLMEGRETARRSRARRLAESSAAPKPCK
ncbi:hypothetical protein ABB37_04248 [Leptomonas pyrrhocoris]|uniref:Uncharacterized protein n=1 Tax=Leptomonas pyrrhocoris TaxID=157538 RepID=A0A0M9G2E7_LEPPY|nr:hypothetical protein ABB37_04248 [Leptomonas pyrrhocoris]XP_015659255.1 hypothetical protein ABB37_04248 [Leptomonas pyrrhocoris]XP_015659256.1 hypothetical protein ABB37_04248 [Leptomonas pyrrhocoris]KPA80815.1 hypothetical protein ABB37_04248 [Leptomonas pyrrhocoris]KPA80816.1 hypothetical protein ABB37_04248 [Leptomonas pyrrhocoris]KPA80817.1 hypothetical protein ABB37_04248 [Leptomonas pyrrhocoris]|eukprot:XP_015659254.1 hypothetical protein ABB37_04248 [Leptomonas pyrrhocoris]